MEQSETNTSETDWRITMKGMSQFRPGERVADRRRSGGHAGRIAALLLRIVDAGLWTTIVVAPLVMGGRHPIGRLLLAVLVAVSALAWLVRQCVIDRPRWKSTAVQWLLLAAVLLVHVQTLSLPGPLLDFLSPAIGERLTVSPTGGSTGDGWWRTISLTPIETQRGLAVLLTHGLLLLLVVQRLADFRDVERILRPVALAAVVTALLGIVQLLFGNGKFLWVYEHPFVDTSHEAKGPFSNPNHFTQFLSLGIGPLAYFLMRPAFCRRSRREAEWTGNVGETSRGDIPTPIVVLGLGIVLFAGMLSLSRGGMLAMLVAAGVMIIAAVRLSLIGRQTFTALVLVSMLLAAAMSIIGHESVARELASLRLHSLEDAFHQLGRWPIWQANLKGAIEHPLLGTGIGSHREVYPLYFEPYNSVEYTHAESGYLQILLELGGVGLLLLLAGMGLCWRWCRVGFREGQTPPARFAAAAVAASLAASAVHSAFDFVWYVGGCLSVTVVLAAVPCRLAQWAGVGIAEESNHRTAAAPASPRTRWAWIVATAGTCHLAAFMVAALMPPAAASLPWDRYLRLTQRRPVDDLPSLERLSLSIDSLKETVRRDPYDARAHLRLASAYRQRFDVSNRALEGMPLAHVREAAYAAESASSNARWRWLRKVLGSGGKELLLAHPHAVRSLQLCPLQGEGYVHLAELAFLNGSSTDTADEYLAQALRVRPHRAEVLVALGNQAAARNEIDQARQWWTRAMASDVDCRQTLITQFAPQLPAEVLLSMVPGRVDALQQLFLEYRHIGRDDQARIVGAVYARHLE